MKKEDYGIKTDALANLRLNIYDTCNSLLEKIKDAEASELLTLPEVIKSMAELIKALR